jgi:hypothetical protein
MREAALMRDQLARSLAKQFMMLFELIVVHDLTGETARCNHTPAQPASEMR